MINTFQTGQNICQFRNQLWGEILVEENAQRLSLTISAIGHVGRKCVYRWKIVFLEARMLFKNLLFTHPVSQPAEHIVDGNPHSTNARFTTALIRLDGNTRFRQRLLPHPIMAQNHLL